MSDEEKEAPPAEGAAARDGAETAEAPAAPAASDELALAKADAAKFREQLLRTAADFDNFRKRTRKELDDERRRGKEQALKDLLPVFDNLERALHGGGTDAKSLLDGLRIVMRQFEGALGKIGVERVRATGVPFDPNLHEAIQHVDSTEHPAGTVVTEVQAGYRIGEYLMRAAMVIVSRGPGPSASAEPKPAETPAETPAEAPAEPDA